MDTGTESKMAPLLGSKPDCIEQTHPHALERYRCFVSEVHDLLSEAQFTGEDVTLYLSEEEQAALDSYAREIIEWLAKCRKDSDEISLLIYLYSMSPNYSMSNLKMLLRTAIERKTEKARQEQEKKERQAREEADKKKCKTALKEIAPPYEKAEQYLSQADYQQFRDSIPGAIDAYLTRDPKAEAWNPGLWLFSEWGITYHRWTELVKERQQAEAEQRRAERERDEHINAVSVAAEKLKKKLRHVKKPKMAVHLALEGHWPEYWCELQLPRKDEVHKWAGQRLLELLPQVLVDVTGWELSYQVQAVPEAGYESNGDVPCLLWTYETHVLVTAKLKLTGGVIRKRRPAGYLVEEPAEGEVLGTIYLGPREWLTPGSFLTPLALLSMFAKGEMEATGIIVEEHSIGYTSFSIAGLEETVEVHEDFRRFIREVTEKQPLGKALLSAGFVDKDTAHLIEVKKDIPLPDSTLVPAASIEAADSGPVITALEGMGYQKAEINEAITATTFFSGMSLEDKIKAVLQALGT